MRHDESSGSFLSRWMRWGRRAHGTDDPADYGTAFGLDLSMEDGVPRAPQPAASPSADGRSWLAHWLPF